MPPPTLWNGGRLFNLPGMNRDNAPAKPIDPGMLARATQNVRGWLGMNTQPGGSELPFFPPGKPLEPVAPSAVGRRFDYPTAYNVNIRPRSYEPIDFATLRALAEPATGGWDLIRIAIETRKDQMAKLTYSILPKKPANAQVRPKSDARCERVESFLQHPDGEHAWADWIRMLLEEHLVIDAASIYRHATVGGDVAKLQILDGSTIKPLLSYDGRRPAGAPAYQQILKGLTAVDYTADELIYAPRNPRVNRVYGYSPVEQVIVTINIGLRRQASQMGYFSDGTVPDAIAQVPPDWSTQRIQEFQDYWDTICNDAVRRRKLKFVPGGVAFQMTRNDTALVDQFDEWLARVVQYAFSLPPTPLVRQVNRAVAENAYEQSLDEGLQPLMTWVKNIIDTIISKWFKLPDLEMVWDDIKDVDPADKEQRDLPLIQVGCISRDDLRAERGLEPLGIPPVVQGIGPLGFMSISAMIKAINNGWDLAGMPQPAMPGMPGALPGGPPGSPPGAPPGGTPEGIDPSVVGSGGPSDPLAGLPPDILEALGIQAQPPADGATVLNAPPVRDISAADAADPGELAPHQAAQPGPVPGKGRGGTVIPIHQHPAMLQALADGEAHAKRVAAQMHRAAR